MRVRLGMRIPGTRKPAGIPGTDDQAGALATIAIVGLAFAFFWVAYQLTGRW